MTPSRHLESPNLATRYMAWQKLHSEGTGVEKELADIFNNDDNPRFRARAFWLLTKLQGKGQDYINKALKDKNEDIRTAAFKAAREIKMDVIPLVKQVADDPSAQVRREALIALRHSASPEAPALWASLAQKYDGKDRWYLEALGISADKQWDAYFAAWKSRVGEKWNTTEGRDIVWRSRAAAALPMLATIIRDPAIDLSKNLKFFRAFDFHKDTSKQRILLDLLNGSGAPGNLQNEKLIKVYSLLQLDTSSLVITPDLKKTIDASLESVKGTQQFLDLLAKYKIKNKNAELLEMAKNNNDHDIKTTAVKLLIANHGENLLKSGIHSDTATAMILVRAMGGIENDQAKDILLSVVKDKALDLKLRQKATQMYGNGWDGQDKLMTLVSSGKLPADMDSTAQKLLLKAWRSDVNQKAVAFYNKGEKKSELAPVADLVKLNGNAVNGKIIFSNTCSSCHQVNNSGINFGPDLSEIGAKYAKDGLYNNIMNPDAGIAFGYDGFLIKTKDGNSVLGYVTSETKDDISVNSIGGIITKIKKNTIISKTPYKHSLMPTGLLNGMKQQDVVDLVEYVSTLKQKK